MLPNLLSNSLKLQILLDQEPEREKLACFRENDNIVQLPLYTPKDHNISGQVLITVKQGCKLSYRRIQMELIGTLIANYGKKSMRQDFLVLSQCLSTKNELINENKSFAFLFSLEDFETKYETYNSANVNVIYLLRATLEINYAKSLVEEQEFILQTPVEHPLARDSLKLNLRIADFLITEVEMERKDYYLDDCVMGKIIMECVKLRLEKIQVGLIKREIIKVSNNNIMKTDEIITKETIFNGNPKDGDMLPFKIHLSPFNLSPNLKEPEIQYSRKYILAISFHDDQGRSLFKHLEIYLWRRN